MTHMGHVSTGLRPNMLLLMMINNVYTTLSWWQERVWPKEASRGNRFAH